VLSPATIGEIGTVLCIALSDALKRGYVGRNVAVLIDAPRPVRSELAPWAPQQPWAFLKAAEGGTL